jgi:hypothetical protein
MTGSGTRLSPRKIRSWHLLVVLGVVLAIDVAWAVASW